jgi:hypothetical protein
VSLLRQLFQQKDATSGEAVAAHDEQLQLKQKDATCDDAAAAHDEQVQLPDDQQLEVIVLYSC